MRTIVLAVMTFTILCSFQKNDINTDLLNKIRISQKDNYSLREMRDFFNWIDSIEVAMPLDSFRTLGNESDYKIAINKNLASNNKYRKAVSFRLIHLASDTSYNKVLVSNMFSNDTLPAAWAYAALCHLSPKSTNIAFEWLILFEDFGDAHWLPLYLTMDTASIINTGYQHINDTSTIAKIFSLQSVCMFDKSLTADSLARSCIKQWSDENIGYAIVALAFCQRGNYKELLEPFINKQHLRPTIIQALKDSPTKEDQDYATYLEK